ncbi:MAG: MFS transporter [bacterium]|nr:MFS transporter [bacterium]
MFKLTKQEKSWILYDVGNSAFILLVSTLLPLFFEQLATKDGVSSVTYLAYWGYATSIATILTVLLGPILGAKGDQKDRKRILFLIVVVIGASCCALTGFISHWLVFLVMFIVTKTVYTLSLIYYDSMLMEVTTKERMDRISSMGFAWGYIGSCIPFVLSLALVLLYEKIGISISLAFSLAFLINGAWWALLSCPLLKNYKQQHYRKETDKDSNVFLEILHTLKDIKHDRKVFLFLIAFFFYMDGVYTIIDMSTIYGKSLGLNSSGLLLALLLTQLIAFPCALLFGRLSCRFKTERLITICILAYTGISIFAIFMDQVIEFWILAALVGIFQGGIQALSRSYYAKIIPADKSSEYYSIMDICGKGASFLGVTLISIITQLTGNGTKGISVVSLLIITGLILFRITIRTENGDSDTAVEVMSLAEED